MSEAFAAVVIAAVAFGATNLENIQATKRVDLEIRPGIFDARRDSNLRCEVKNSINPIENLFQNRHITNITLHELKSSATKALQPGEIVLSPLP